MNKYQEIYETPRISLTQAEALNALDTMESWEDGYWLAKILMTSNDGVSDERIIDTFEYCFFAGLSIANKEIFFDANECLAKLYIRYGMFNEAAAKLMVLAYNFECPDWVHLYLAMTQLHTMFERLVEEPKFFFERLSAANFDNSETRSEVRNIFGKYLCAIVEETPACEVATTEIVRFAEQIKFTTSDEFKLFHKTICPNIEYLPMADDTEDLEKLRASETAAKKKATELEAELSKAKKAEEEYQRKLQAQQLEMVRLKRENETSVEQRKTAEATYREELTAKNSDIAKLQGEKSLLAARLQELENAKKTSMLPQNIDDVYQQITTWLNCSLRRYLAQWLTNHFERNCRGDYWNRKVKPALLPPELKKFDSYKELTDFALDAVLNIYYHNFNDFYTYDSWAKANDRERIEEMQQIRNRWVGHFEENSWTKEKILFDLDTIIEFIEQIEMPKERQKEYLAYRSAVAAMN